jgi:hypothetical protein
VEFGALLISGLSKVNIFGFAWCFFFRRACYWDEEYLLLGYDAVLCVATCLLAASLNYSTTLKMEAIRSSETSGTTQRTTRRHIPEEDTLQNHRCENLKSYMLLGWSYAFNIHGLENIGNGWNTKTSRSRSSKNVWTDRLIGNVSYGNFSAF